MKRKKRKMTMEEFNSKVNMLKSRPAQPEEVRRHFLVESKAIENLADASRRWMFAKKHGVNSE